MTTKRSWARVAFAMFAVGWGANQFSPMLIVYRHELGLRAGAVAGLFVVYAITLIPGLLAGGPASDRFGRRAVLIPLVVASPIATLLLVVGSRSLTLIIVGRALAGLCSGVVFSSATAWVQDLSAGSSSGGSSSGGAGVSARRAALALTAGFGLGPFTAAMLAQFAPDPAVIPYIPHLVIGTAAAIVVWPVPDVPRSAPPGGPRRRGVPAAFRQPRFWLGIAPSAPFVFGTISLALVVLPEEVTSAKSLSAGFTAVVTAFAFCGGAGVQRLARRMEIRLPFSGNVAGQCCALAGVLIAIPAVAGPNETLAVVAAVFLGLSYGLNLVAGLQQSERLTDPRDRGTVIACYYALAYLGFGVPYLIDALNFAAGRTGAFVIFACVAVVVAILAAGTAAYTRPPTAPAIQVRRAQVASADKD
jgi:MFS family permease